MLDYSKLRNTMRITLQIQDLGLCSDIYISQLFTGDFPKLNVQSCESVHRVILPRTKDVYGEARWSKENDINQCYSSTLSIRAPNVLTFSLVSASILMIKLASTLYHKQTAFVLLKAHSPLIISYWKSINDFRFRLWNCIILLVLLTESLGQTKRK